MDALLGPPVSTDPAAVPPRTPLHGRYTSLVPLEPSHAPASFKHLAGEGNAQPWTFMFGGPYNTEAEWQTAVDGWCKASDPLCYAVLAKPTPDAGSPEPVGLMSFMNIVPTHRRLEIGSIIFGQALRKTRMATEAFYLTMKHAFDDLGYSRFEWKANHLNKPSLAAAERLGFVFEGIFRKHMIIKGRSRDTAWYSITEDEWPVIKKALETWLSDDNFDENGRQIRDLKEIRASIHTDAA
ncbi:unnamed protein product [Clonostachys rosea f. rosea IK726]|uniref:N-acetyltransferase domain-containing protein n=2 Tax=Bionectria ochroleuca TaxID=29856 RepID=A0A0B7KF44_BIOOC|nr:unnamed protein product [Clonostachys rosea f. rosea IK726]